jgi:hypothetical protein
LLALSACKKNEVRFEQYQEVDAPGVGHGVRLYLGDVSRGEYAPVRVLDAKGEPIAEAYLGVGDELPFVVEGQWYAVVVVRYIDHLIGDEGILRVVRRKPPSGPPVVRVAEGDLEPIPGLPGMTIGVDEIVDHHRAYVRVREGTQGGEPLISRTVSAGDVIELPSAHLTVVSFEGHTRDHDWALFRVEP